ncbi:cell attachment protein [meleucus virus]|uniref:Cell attachment protein n=1 Tax=meleucus virus TaxID=2940994 RepID=A0AAE9KYQ5_9MONO|nr:cell attachment protein [meleucus virus]
MSSIYYTGGRSPQINTQHTYANMPPFIPLRNRKSTLIKAALKIVAVVSFIAALVNIVLGIIVIAQGANSRLKFEKLQLVTSSTDITTAQLLKEQHEFTSPYLRNIMDAVTYQIPRLISNSWSTTNPKPVTPQSPPIIINQGECLTGGDLVAGLKYLYGNLTYTLQSYVLEAQTTTHPLLTLNRRVDIINRPRMNPTSMYNMGSCNRASFDQPYNFFPAYVGTATGDLVGTCTRQPVLQIWDGYYALTYMTFRGTCQDHTHSSRHFEFGVIKRDGYLDPVMMSLFHFTKSAVPALDGCILGMNMSRAYALCSTTNKGPPMDIHEGRTPGLMLYVFGVNGELEEIPIDPSTFSGYVTGTILVPLAGQAVVRGRHLIGFGYMTTLQEEIGTSKCVSNNCGSDTQHACDANSRIYISDGNPRSMVVIMLDLSDGTTSDDRILLIPRDQYYQIMPGNIFHSQNDDYLLYSLTNHGWYDKPIYGKLFLNGHVRMEEYPRDYDRISSTATCTTPFGCPSTCSVTTAPTYVPITSDFSVAVGVLSLSQGRTPVVTHAQENRRIDIKQVRDSTVEVRETSLVCYTQMPRIDKYVFCTAVFTIVHQGNQNPTLSAVTWYHPDICQ